MMVKKKMLTNLFVTSDGPIQILDTSVSSGIAPNLSGFQKSVEGGKSTLITIAGNYRIILSTCQITLSRRALV